MKYNLNTLLLLFLSNALFASSIKLSKSKMKNNATDYIQESIDIAYTNKLDSVIFPEGTYFLKSIKIAPGITYCSFGNTVLKRLPNMAKFARMFDTESGKYLTLYNSEPKITRFKNLKFDGNLDEQGPYRNYELQQQHLIMLTSNIKSQNAFKVEIDSCEFYNCVADGVSVRNNMNVTITNSKFTNIFRGGLVVTGGKTIVNCINASFTGKPNYSGVHIEVDGIGKFEKIEILITNCTFESSKFNVTMNGGEVKFYNNFCNNIRMQYKLLNNSTLKLTNNNFKNVSKRTDVYYPNKLIIDSCNFETTDSANFGSIFNVLWNTKYSKNLNNQKLFITNSIFTNKSNNNIDAIKLNTDDPNKNNQTTITNNKFKNFKSAVNIIKGGNIRIKNNVLTSVKKEIENGNNINNIIEF